MDREANIEAMELKQLRSQYTPTERTREFENTKDQMSPAALSLQWEEVFKRFDRDRDGKISYKELKKELNASHCVPPDVKRILRRGDINEDGYLDFNEFLALMQESKDLRGVFSQSLNKWVKSVCYIPKRRPVVYADVIDARGQYEEEYSCWPPPLCMLLISLLEITIYVYDAVVRKPNQPYVQTELASLFVYNPHRRSEAWRFLTYMFVHIGVFHLIVNLFVQIMLGIPLEMVHRWWRVLIIYVLGVIAGSLATSISDPRVLLAGASGGVYAIIAAHVATLIMNWKEMEFAVGQLVIFILLAASDIGTAVYNRYILNVEDQISYVAHIAGATAGLLLGINILRNLEVQKWEKVLWWVSIILYTLLMVVAIVWHVAFPDYFPKQYV